jgi:hypothetical protein
MRGRNKIVAVNYSAGEEVKRRRLLRLLENPEPIWKTEDHPELEDGAGACVERMRAEDERLNRQRE